MWSSTTRASEDVKCHSHDAIESLQFEMNANVYGLIRVAQAFAPVLKANGGGAFVQLNSVASVKTFPDFATYCASKAASYSITQGLRGSLRGQGTHVVSVHPGPIQTDMAVAAGFGDCNSSPSLVAMPIFDAIARRSFSRLARSIGRADRCGLSSLRRKCRRSGHGGKSCVSCSRTVWRRPTVESAKVVVTSATAKQEQPYG